jgi:hypothetical protein
MRAGQVGKNRGDQKKRREHRDYKIIGKSRGHLQCVLCRNGFNGAPERIFDSAQNTATPFWGRSIRKDVSHATHTGLDAVHG